MEAVVHLCDCIVVSIGNKFERLFCYYWVLIQEIKFSLLPSSILILFQEECLNVIIKFDYSWLFMILWNSMVWEVKTCSELAMEKLHQQTIFKSHKRYNTGPRTSAGRVLQNTVCPSVRLSERFSGIGSLVFLKLSMV